MALETLRAAFGEKHLLTPRRVSLESEDLVWFDARAQSLGAPLLRDKPLEEVAHENVGVCCPARDRFGLQDRAQGLGVDFAQQRQCADGRTEQALYPFSGFLRRRILVRAKFARQRATGGYEIRDSCRVRFVRGRSFGHLFYPVINQI